MGKGSGFEREMCKDLSLWWTDEDEKRDDIFWRTAGSGARRTIRQKNSKLKTANSAGDMACLDPEFGKELIDFAVFEFKRGYSSKRLLNNIEIEKVLRAQMGMEERIKRLRKLFDKSRKPPTDYGLLGLVDSKGNSILTDFVAKAEKEVHESGRETYFLIFKRDSHTRVICMTNAILGKMEDICSEFPGNVIIVESEETESFFCLLNYDEWKEWFSSKDMRSLIENVKIEKEGGIC